MTGERLTGHPATLVMSVLYFATSYMVWLLPGAVGLSMAAELRLSPAETGFLVAVPLLGGALVRIPLGMLVDRIGPWKTGLACQALTLVPLAWGWLGGRTYPELTVIGLLLGLGGGSFAVALPLAARWSPPAKQGVVLGIVGAANAGSGIASLFAPRLADSLGWHAVFGLGAVPVAAVLVLFALVAKESPDPPPPRRWAEVAAVVRRRETLWFSLMYGFTFGGFVGLSSFLLIFLHEEYGMTRTAAGTVTAAAVFAGSFMRAAGGFLADRLGGKRVLAAVFVAASLGLAVVAFRPPLSTGLPLLFALMVGLGAGNGALFQLVPQAFRKDLGVATGVIGAAGGLAGFLLPSGLGLIKQFTGQYYAGFFCLSLAGAYALAVLPLAARGIPSSTPSVSPGPAIESGPRS